MSAQLLHLFHLGPLVDSDLSIVASSIEVAVAKFESQHPASQTLYQLLMGKLLHEMRITSGASGSKELRS